MGKQDSIQSGAAVHSSSFGVTSFLGHDAQRRDSIEASAFRRRHLDRHSRHRTIASIFQNHVQTTRLSWHLTMAARPESSCTGQCLHL